MCEREQAGAAFVERDIAMEVGDAINIVGRDERNVASGEADRQNDSISASLTSAEIVREFIGLTDPKELSVH